MFYKCFLYWSAGLWIVIIVKIVNIIKIVIIVNVVPPGAGLSFLSGCRVLCLFFIIFCLIPNDKIDKIDNIDNIDNPF